MSRLILIRQLRKAPTLAVIANNNFIQVEKIDPAAFQKERYFVQLYGIQKRLYISNKFITHEMTTGIVGPDVEFVCLQFRKLLEQIAMLSLIAHVDEYSKIQSHFASQWNAKKILKEIESLNENYYPIPAKVNEDVRGKFIDPIRNLDYLSKDEFLELYQICSSVIHAENPYVEKPKTPMPIAATFKKWYDKIHNLMRSHVLVLYKMEYTFYGELFNETGAPRVQILEKISD